MRRGPSRSASSDACSYDALPIADTMPIGIMISVAVVRCGRRQRRSQRLRSLNTRPETLRGGAARR
jgi:hypothetical protein